MAESKRTVDVSQFQGKFYDKPNTKNLDKGAQKKTQSELSDDAYQEITKRVIDITEIRLDKQSQDKEKLRKPLQTYISIFLLMQFFVLVVMLCFNDFCFNLDEGIIKTYIVSVFAETLAGFIVMVRFAFSNKQEVELIGILNSVVSNFQVYRNGQESQDDE